MNVGTRNYAIVTAAYWGFTLTDGALRMLVLLTSSSSAIRPSRSPSCSCSTRQRASLANLVGGWLASRYGISRMLAVGLATQIVGFLLLSALYRAGRQLCR